jgi:opacity protein-like surface antigen
MKQLLNTLAYLLIFTLYSSAGALRVGGSIGYYSVADSIYKDTYGSGDFIYGGSLSYDLLRSFEIRGEVGYFKDKGEMTLTQEEIKFSMIPVVIGMRVKLVKIKKLSPYLGAGVDFCSYKERSRLGDTSESTVGFHIEGGSYIALGQRFHIDLNLRYVKADAQPFDETIKLGGWRAGVGVEYSF